MSAPAGFSWIDKPLLAALGMPRSPAELDWLRAEGIELLISLTEEPPYNRWINDAGLMVVHVPIIDMEAPSQDQLDKCVSTIAKANERNMGVGVHCGAGLGRTGTVIACYFVSKGLSPDNALARIRRLRPGSVETEDQEQAVAAYARRLQH
ncbi:MAG: dual specificity protein phosphatase 23 [Gemmataceae bacterium]